MQPDMVQTLEPVSTLAIRIENLGTIKHASRTLFVSKAEATRPLVTSPLDLSGILIWGWQNF